jgi:hypothetical protein
VVEGVSVPVAVDVDVGVVEGVSVPVAVDVGVDVDVGVVEGVSVPVAVDVGAEVTAEEDDASDSPAPGPLPRSDRISTSRAPSATGTPTAPTLARTTSVQTIVATGTD